MTTSFSFSKTRQNGIFNQLLSTQNVKVARFARNAEWDFFCENVPDEFAFKLIVFIWTLSKVTPVANGYPLEFVCLSSNRMWTLVIVTSKFLMIFAKSLCIHPSEASSWPLSFSLCNSNCLASSAFCKRFCLASNWIVRSLSSSYWTEVEGTRSKCNPSISIVVGAVHKLNQGILMISLKMEKIIKIANFDKTMNFDEYVKMSTLIKMWILMEMWILIKKMWILI